MTRTISLALGFAMLSGTMPAGKLDVPPILAWLGHMSLRGSTHATIAQTQPAAPRPLVRIPVADPPRHKRPSFVPSAIRPPVVRLVRSGGAGVRVAAPPMLRPNQIDQVLHAARVQAQSRSSKVAMPKPAVAAPSPPVTVGRARPGAPVGAAAPKSAVRTTASLSGVTSGTGINPWWRYQEQSVPGGGRVMVNVGTGNVLLQDDDMNVPNKGIALAFRRTYNSQSLHDVNASDAAGFYFEPPGMYGNGWTSTFDARITRNADGTLFTVFDIDGARYDFVSDASGLTPGPGNHTTLAGDGSCGFLWTKKSGTVYYFYRPNPAGSCSFTGGLTGGYAGRLYQIIGRNRNTYISFSYAWDGGIASSTGKISSITAQTEAGQAATLYFGDINGHRLLQQLVYPDGTTSVWYGYDASGNLTWVSRPENNASGVRPLQTFGYQSIGTGSVLGWVASPRYNAGCNGAGCGTDGALLNFTFTGSTVDTSALTSIWHYGVVNPVVADGTNSGALQGSSYPTSAFWYLGESYTTGVTTPTYRDTDGHMTNWVVDNSGRPTQTQECTASTTQGQQCTGQWLLLNEGWDANNNLVSEMDPRGYQTDYAYDANGNTTAVGAPSVAAQTAQGTATFRPTKLFSYDTYNNVRSACDERWSHANGRDWNVTGNPGTSDNLCPTQAGTSSSPGASVVNYETTTADPFGRIASIVSPLGYRVTFSYNTSSQGGDFGLPSDAIGDAYVQNDGSTFQEHRSFAYDANGNLTSYGTGSGTWSLSYDALNRPTVITDPDGYSSYNYYFADGSKSKTETPTQHAAGLGALFAYDIDDNVTQETRHFACTSASTCSAGVTQKWYDGTDRLIEVQQPQDPTDMYPFPWRTRYVYDLTAGGTVTVAGQLVHAYGGHYKTQEWLSGTTPTWTEPGFLSQSELTPPTPPAPAWADISGTATDALDRAIAEYRDNVATTKSYDAVGNLGLLSQTCNGASECASFQYDGRSKVQQISFSPATTPARIYAYDESGRETSVTSANGTATTTYDAAGHESQRTQSIVQSGRTGRIDYHTYPNGDRSSLDITTQAGTSSGVIAYSYRPDDKLSTLRYNYGLAATWNFTYSGAGRMTQRSDTLNPSPMTNAYDPSTYGLVSSMMLPGGQNRALVYDAEGELLNGLNGSSYVNIYTKRGELLPNSPKPAKIGFANGALINVQYSAGGSYYKPSSYHLNAALGVPTEVHSANPCIGYNGNCGQNTNGDTSSDTTYVYDRTQRQGGSGVTGTTDVNGDPPSEGGIGKTYDAENHLLREDFSNMPFRKQKFPQTWSLQYVYGPSGHPTMVGTTSVVSGGPPTDFQYDSLFWDGDSLLFSEDSLGNIDNIKVGTMAEYVRQATLVAGGAGPLIAVYDRDTKGQPVGCHSSDGAAVEAGPYSNGQAGGFTVVCYTQPGSPTVGRGGLLTTPRTDGLFDGWNTIQGVRSYDTQAGIWNTPDEYRGRVHDPMSQKAYMWNGNNPYVYADPSGYDEQQIDRAIQATILGGLDAGLARGLAERELSQNARTIAIQNARLASSAKSGRLFEQTSGTNGPKTRIQYPNGGQGVPDRITKTTVEEAKSGKYQANTAQLRGQQDYAAQNGLDHILHTYDDIKLSAPLQDLIDGGKIIQKTYPRPPMQIK